ncbi:MAG: 6-phosphogluconolactonase [Gammaproteobacteria bacterium]|nr:6-phosphogluconolactonase [Gammaproteobacteria bacterium]
MVEEVFFASKAQLVQELASACANSLEAAICARKGASFLVSGGSTPEPVYRALSEWPLPWEQVEIALVDERWVDKTQSGSNYAFINSTLLQGAAAQASLLGMKNASITASEGWATCESVYRKIVRPYDLCLLGMGNDGHTASLFPQAEGLKVALELKSGRLCVPISARKSTVTGSFTERMSLTLEAILQAREIKLLFTGEEKLQVYRQAYLGNDERIMPVRSILKQKNTPVTVYWAP